MVSKMDNRPQSFDALVWSEQKFMHITLSLRHEADEY
jgi:hypothetical protein